ncbi:signal protein PDZ, partial [Streptomyces sp. SID2955]|nr:signal protein PDZ [Streptomyces sp. SID2955]
TSLSEALAAARPGARTRVTYERDGSGKSVEVTLGEQ